MRRTARRVGVAHRRKHDRPLTWRRLIARPLIVLAALVGAERAVAQVQFTSTPVTSATVGQPYRYDVTASTSDANVTITAPFGLPPWLSLEPTGNGTATLSGTPPAAEKVAIYLRAQYGACARFVFLCPVQSFPITVVEVPNAPPVVVPPGIPDRSITQGEQLNLDIAPSFSDPDGDPLTFSAAGLPSGFVLVGSTVSGVASAATVAGSPYTVSVTARDTRGASVADAFVLSAVPLARADVYVTGFEATPSPATLGASADWVVTVGNEGPSPSGAVDVTLELAGAPFAFAANSCTATAPADGRQRLVCSVGPLASGATQPLKLTGSGSAAGEIFATVTAVGTSTVPIDPDSANNTAAASLSLAQSVGSDPAQALAGGAAAVAAADLNGDGFADLVRTATGEPPALLLDIDDPAQLHPSLEQPEAERRGLASVPLGFGVAATGRDLALADFDHDGRVDVAVANGAGVPSAVYHGDGTGVMSELAALGPAARDDRAVAAADVDGDGFVDLVVASATGNTLHLNRSGAAFAAQALPALNGVGGLDVVLADVVGTALPDLIFVYGIGPTVRHENLGGGSFGAAVTIETGPVAAAASADFNGDGRADLVLARPTADATGFAGLRVYLNDGRGGFGAPATLGAAPARAVLPGDVDGDGLHDLVALGAGGVHRLYLGNGTGQFELHPHALVSRGAASGAIGPFGRAQHADLALAGPDAIHVFFNDGRGNLGLGDTTRPVIELKGTAAISMEVSSTYSDPGATAHDDVDGPLTPTVTNPVNPAIVGAYTVTYAARDSAGNAAVPVTRAVTVTALAPEGGGGGGAVSGPLLALLLVPLLARVRSRRR